MKTIFAITLLLSFLSCKKTEIILLCNNNKGKIINEIYLIESPPKDTFKLNQLMLEFNRDLNINNVYGERIFLKPHKNSMLDIAFRDVINYRRDSCKEIDNMDFICKVSKYTYHSGGDTIQYYYFP